MSVVIETKGITKDFYAGDTPIRVLFGIDVTINSGQLTMLVGPSGCGKTTLISILAGILSPTEGEIIIGNTNLTQMHDTDKTVFRRNYFGFVFQQYNLLPTLTVSENIAIPLIASGVPFDEAVDKARDLLKKIDMGAHTEKLPKQLSGGQQQRIAFARALVHDPKVIICDEPTAALDAHTGQKVMEILKQTAVKPDCAVLVVTHDNRIFHFADRMIYMSDGKVVPNPVDGVNV